MDGDILGGAILGSRVKRACCIAAGILLLAFGVVKLLQAQGYLLPSWIDWQSRAWTDGEITVELKSRSVTVLKDGVTLWQSDPSVPVQDVLWGDIDHDEEPELMLLCWKRGRYGESRPFWVTEDDRTWSQHIYLYDWTGETVKPIWMASDLGREVITWSFTEEDRLVVTDRQGNVTAWDWLSWGLRQIELPTKTLRFAALGDNLIHRPIYHYAMTHFSGCFDDLYTGIGEELGQYDLVSINQETVFVTEGYSDYPFFATPIEVGQAQADAGFSIVTCATNHIMDQGESAIDRTVEFYRQQEITCLGIQHSTDESYEPYVLLEENGISCALFSYTLTSNCGVPDQSHMLHMLLDEAQIREDLRQGREEADVVVVYVHWGTEYEAEPDETQLYWAEVFAQCGVDVVIGTHPHVVQPMQWVAGENGHETLVYYSLGNYISAQTAPDCQRGGLAYFTVEKQNGQCQIRDYGMKYLLTSEDNGHYTTSLLSESE